MNHPYGPWAILINAGRNPQLSAFWRQRLGMLVPVSQSSAALSRRSAVLLVAAALFVFLLPTFRAAPAVDAAEKPAGEKKPGSSAQATVELGVASEDRVNGVYSGASLALNAVPPPKGFIALPAYRVLNAVEDRSRFHITADEEKTLGQLAAQFQSESSRLNAALSEEVNKLPPDKRQAELDESVIKYKQRRAVALRQIEQALTPQHLAAVRRWEMIEFATSVRYTGERLGLGLSKRQIEQLDALTTNGGPKWPFDYLEKWLGVLTPPQREKLMRDAADPRFNMPIDLTNSYVTTICILDMTDGYVTQGSGQPGLFRFVSRDPTAARYAPALIVCPLLSFAQVRQKIGLTAEEEARLQAISDRSQAAAEEIFKSFGPEEKIDRLPPKEQTARVAERKQKLEALGKEILRQIEATLTPPQSAALKKLAAEITAAAMLQYGPDRIPLSPEQRAKLGRLQDEEAGLVRGFNRQWGEKSLSVLTPAQLQKFEDELDRHEGW